MCFSKFRLGGGGLLRGNPSPLGSLCRKLLQFVAHTDTAGQVKLSVSKQVCVNYGKVYLYCHFSLVTFRTM
jgi:hypothetical protein